jgi:hypothetical protein
LNRLQAIEEQVRENGREIREIKADTKEIKAAAKENLPAQTWADIASTANTAATSLKAKARVKQREIKDDLRKKREPSQVILTTLNKETKETLSTMHAEKIRQQCQNIIDSSTANDTTTAKPKLKGIARITNGIRLECHSQEEAQRVRQIIDWNNAFKELAVHKPKHGVVVHGVRTEQVTGIDDADVQKSLIQEWEEANNDLKIHSIKYLRRKPRTDRTSLNCSIIVFTEDAHAADKCILSGFYIDSEHTSRKSTHHSCI